MNALDLDPDDVGTMFAGDDDCQALVDPTPQPGDKAYAHASAFLNMLDSRRNHWEFRTFGDVVLPNGSKREVPTLVSTIGGSLELALPRLKKMNSLGAGVFVTINRTDGKGRATKNVTDVVAIFADTDGVLG